MAGGAGRFDGLRLAGAAVGILTGLVFVLLLNVLLAPYENTTVARLLVDFRVFLWPFSIQNVMWVVFFVALGDVSVRFLEAMREAAQVRRRYLPEDERTVLQAKDLGPIYAEVKAAPRSDRRFVTRLIRRLILQFQSNRSVDQANLLLNSSLELYLHEIDLKYNMVRYVMWLIPSLGFIGTVIGIAMALNHAGTADFQDPALLNELTARLGTAFYTTLMALLLSAILVFLLHLSQGREERALNDAGQYCLDNLVNRLYVR